MEKFSYLKSSNVGYIDDLFVRYLADPDSIDPSWRYFFDGLELGTETALADGGHSNGHATLTPVPGGAANSVTPASPAIAPVIGIDLGAEAKVAELINAYRARGRLLADINPLTPPPSSRPSLDLVAFGLTEADLPKTFQAGKLIGIGPATLANIVQALRDTYCGKVAVELVDIEAREAREWILKRLESTRNREILDGDTKKMLLKRLSDAEGFERFLHTRYVAAKRFSIEGGEATIPALDCIIETAAELGSQEIVMGMAHRGRLNVLTNIFGKKPELIFTEFEGKYAVDTAMGEGDVKYHKGASADVTTRKGKRVHLSLAFNPSHLEFVNAVVEGVARAKQDRLSDTDRTKVLPITIHGDAAFAGQGVCYEVLNLSQLKGYATGGTLHIVINNQVGFTTDPTDSRSTSYCTDLAKMLDAPIFHVNGDDPEAVWHVAKVATEFRQKFKQDVFIDLICYRKHGHNEGDEPSFTQPLLYKKIKAHASPREVYAERLAKEGVSPAADSQAVVDEITAKLSAAQAIAKAENPTPKNSMFEAEWKGMKQPATADMFMPVPTMVEAGKLLTLAEKINAMPAGFNLHSKLARFFDARLKAVKDGKGIDWGNGEALAYASLIADGCPVRLSGQDAERGTFTHRHSIVHDVETGQEYSPINAAANKDGATYQVFNSHLSETGVMGFEYGYSLAAPKSLVIWEAQFGDFANGAQVIIDQFLCSSESKWQRMSGLVLLLPHGYEGQGPEHSSARLERFLQLCGKDNMIVGNFTTPAQIFHALRRQVKREFRKPLVVMSPKSLLRNPHAISTIEEFTQMSFREAIDDPIFDGRDDDAAKVKKVIVCSGKVYYDLVAERAAREKTAEVAIVRVEQLYPWPEAQVAAALERYKNADIVWAQEEPRNMGAWTYVFNLWMGGTGDFAEQVGNRFVRYAGRPIAAAPAVGSHKVHEAELKALLQQAFGE